MEVIRNIVREENEVQETSTPETYDSTEIACLVEWAANDHIEAFGELYAIYLDRIYRYVFYQVNDKMTAEDLVQDIFLKVWKSLNSYNQKRASFSTWLYRIAHNHVIDYFRTRRLHQILEDDIQDSVTSLEEDAEKMLMQKELSETISGLPPQQRQIIILKFIEGLDNREIAQIMRKREGAIRAMQMRALRNLRQKLSRDGSICGLNNIKSLMNA